MLAHDISRFITSSALTGRAFLRLRDDELVNLGVNVRWRKALAQARDRLRREALGGVLLWGFEGGQPREPEVAKEQEEPKRRTALGFTAESEDEDERLKDEWKKSWRLLGTANTPGSKSKVRQYARAFERENSAGDDSRGSASPKDALRLYTGVPPRKDKHRRSESASSVLSGWSPDDEDELDITVSAGSHSAEVSLSSASFPSTRAPALILPDTISSAGALADVSGDDEPADLAGESATRAVLADITNRKMDSPPTVRNRRDADPETTRAARARAGERKSVLHLFDDVESSLRPIPMTSSANDLRLEDLRLEDGTQSAKLLARLCDSSLPAAPPDHDDEEAAPAAAGGYSALTLPRGSSLEGEGGRKKKGSVVIVRKSQLCELEARLKEVEARLAEALARDDDDDDDELASLERHFAQLTRQNGADDDAAAYIDAQTQRVDDEDGGRVASVLAWLMGGTAAPDEGRTVVPRPSTHPASEVAKATSVGECAASASTLSSAAARANVATWTGLASFAACATLGIAVCLSPPHSTNSQDAG